MKTLMVTIDEYVARWRAVNTYVLFAVLFVQLLCAAQVAVTISGTVTDESGAVVPAARISLSTNGTIVATTKSDTVGRYELRAPPGSYDIWIEHKGYKIRLEHVEIRPESAARADVTLEPTASPFVFRPILSVAKAIATVFRSQAVVLAAPAPTPPPPPAQVSFSDPTWNVWSEAVTSTPNFVPVKMQPNHDYSLVVDLSAVRYSDYSGATVYSQKGSSALSSWLKENAQLSKADVDILVLPDLKFYAPQMQGEKMKCLTINIQKVRDAWEHGFALTDSPFNILRQANANAPFDFGSRTFRIRTGPLTGKAPIALSVWANGKPIDEASFSLCIVANANDPCVPASTTNDTLKGVDLSGRGDLPTAALQLIDRGTDIVGVYRCNDCNWAADDYRTWQIQEPGRSFSDRVKEIVGTVAAGKEPVPGSTVTLAQTFEQAGDSLSNLVFESKDPDVLTVKNSLGEILAKGLDAAQAGHPPPSLFVRVIPSLPDLILVPAGLARLRLPDGTRQFLGPYVDIQSPLEIQDYSKPSGCISKWVLFVPPPPSALPDGEKASFEDVEDARLPVNDQIEEFRKVCADCVIEKENKFYSYVSDADRAPQSEGLVVLSHQAGNAIFFARDGNAAIQSDSIVLPFAAPSFVILDACGSGEPGTSEFVRRFNSVGVDSVIATSTEINPVLAGQFLNKLFELLRKFSWDETYTLSRARFDAVKELMQHTDDNGEYDPRFLMFIFAGNGAIRACVPATEPPKAPTN